MLGAEETRVLKMARAFAVVANYVSTIERFNDWGGRGYDDSSPGRSPKQSLPRIGLHDPLHGRQACPEFIAFDQGVGQICPR